MVDANEPGPDPVIPPPPPGAHGAFPASAPEGIPLAPSLSGPPAPPAGPAVPPASTAPPTPPLPPYASAAYPPPHQVGHPQGGEPQGAAYGGYPMPTSFPPPPPKRSGRTLAIVLAAVGAFVVLVVVGIAVVVGLLVGSRPPEPVSAPVPTAAPTAPSDGSDGSDAEDPPTDEAEPSGIEARLAAKIEEYKRLRDTGALWETIPDTEYNRTAVTAFLYFLTDMKVATIWGVDEAQTREYDERMAMLEERLLAQEPLGDDIEIALEDKIFTYDGETGEGGYTDR